MTDGIIQKVFTRFRKEPYLNRYSELQRDLLNLEQELIEEIKKTIPNSCAKFSNAGGDIFYSDGEEEILKILIGDNQE